ncbi:hypothetical protein TNCV_2793301 [Trichonephila clavipes]|nr:hypothetical protein TNCV_2793301 [Trichonephila clavipes]
MALSGSLPQIDLGVQALNKKFCQRLSKTPMEFMEILSKMYGESTMARSKVYEWHRYFREGRESIEYNECFGRPSASRNTENVRKDRRQTLELSR